MQQLTYNDLLTLLLIVAVGMLIILLYNLILVSVYLRSLTERLNDLSKEVEAVILKPLEAIDHSMRWVLSAFERFTRSGGKKGKKGKHGFVDTNVR